MARRTPQQPSAPVAESIAQAIGNRVRHIRRARHLSQRALAAKARLAYSSVQALETGAREPRYPTLVALAEALEVEPSDLDARLALPATIDPEHVLPGSFAAATTTVTVVPADLNLNHEDLLVARAYNRATTDTRQRVQAALAVDQATRGRAPIPIAVHAQLTDALNRLLQINPSQCSEIVTAFVNHVEATLKMQQQAPKASAPSPAAAQAKR